MAAEDDVPWRALAAASGLGGALFAVWLWIDDVVPELGAAPGTPGYLGYYLGWVVASLALLAGAYGLYRFRGEVAGTSGTAALGLTSIGFAAIAAGGLLNAVTTAPVEEVTLGGRVLFGGLVLALLGGAALGVVGLRVAGFDRRAAALLVLALLVFVVALPLEGVATAVTGLGVTFAAVSVPYGLAWVIFGRSLTVQV